MSGFTVGYESIDELTLEVKLATGTDKEKRQAKKIIPIIHKHHVLLSTLLIANAFALETVPIYVDRIVPSWAAILISGIGVVLIAEIIPMSFCTGPSKYKIAALSAPFVKMLMLFTCCLSRPVGYLLDTVLGGHSKVRYVKKDLKALIELHE